MSKLWSHSAGTRPNTVRVYEREPGGILYARAWDPTANDGKGNFRTKSLGHRDRVRAKRYATEEAAKLQKGESTVADAKVTLAQVFALYQVHKTRDKTKGQQKADAQRIELWTRVLGGSMDPHRITPEQWNTFVRARSAGAIDGRGKPVPPKAQRPVRARTVEIDCLWLRFCFNWAVAWRLPSGRYLMRENPIRGTAFVTPTEKNPRRPLATAEYFAAVRAAATKHTFELRVKKPGTARGFEPVRLPSYLPELLDLANGTARRISAICALRYSDLRLEKGPTAPFGAIQWPGETDKEGRAWTAPLSPAAREAINRVLKARPGAGTAFLFPAPGNPAEPLETRLAGKWLREAEALGGIEHVTGRGWHSFRRKWATERKHLSDVDVAAAGGWKSLEALKRSYQHADEATVLAVVLAGTELREAK